MVTSGAARWELVGNELRVVELIMSDNRDWDDPRTRLSGCKEGTPCAPCFDATESFAR
jgi:hypothetical protein